MNCLVHSICISLGRASLHNQPFDRQVLFPAFLSNISTELSPNNNGSLIQKKNQISLNFVFYLIQSGYRCYLENLWNWCEKHMGYCYQRCGLLKSSLCNFVCRSESHCILDSNSLGTRFCEVTHTYLFHRWVSTFISHLSQNFDN